MNSGVFVPLVNTRIRLCSLVFYFLLCCFILPTSFDLLTFESFMFYFIKTFLVDVVVFKILPLLGSI